MAAAIESVLLQTAELAQARSALAGWAARLPGLARSLGPYAAIELLLPGGSVLALLLWLYRRRRAALAQRAGSANLLCPESRGGGP